MDLPKNCFQCPAHEWFDFGGENHGYQCPILHTTKAVSNCEARTKRRDNCPLIPVPQHGRLKDYDYVMKQYSEWLATVKTGSMKLCFICYRMS